MTEGMEKSTSMNENLVFILEKQSHNLDASKEKTSDGDSYVLQGIAAQFGKENNNSRIYEEGEYLPHLEYLNDKIQQKRLVGELDHPEKFDVSLKNISHVIENLTYDKDGRVLKIKVRLLDTPAGQIAKKLVDAGIPLSISSRAAGNVGPDKKVQIKKIFTYDLVADPGFQDAQLERVYESAGFTYSEFSERTKNSIVNSLECMNESLGIKNDSGLMIYKVDNNEEFEKIFKQEKNKSDIMESTKKEFVTSEELNSYSIFLKKKMDELESQISEMKKTPSTVSENKTEETSELEERVARLEKYSEYLAENLEDAIKYGEYLAENLDSSITYSKYLAENLDKTISYSKYIAENVDKSISYSEYVAENVDKAIDYSKYLAEKVDDNIQYTEYVAENLDKTISYSEYLAENVDRSISYSEYLAENLDKGIAYSEYIAEKLDQGISYTEYLAENVNKNISYSEYIAESLNKGIAYSDYLAEKLNGTISYTESLSEGVKAPKANSLNESARGQAEIASRTELVESGFAGDYASLSNQLDALIESVQTQKTGELQQKAESKFQPAAQTQKAEKTLNENEASAKVQSSGHKFIDEIPEDYAQIWESLNEGHKQSIIAQSTFYNLETPYQIKNFWSTRQLGAKPVGLQKLTESQENPATSTTSAQPYKSDYLNWVAKSLEGKFKN
jgi:muramidase (phage lysozyme)